MIGKIILRKGRIQAQLSLGCSQVQLFHAVCQYSSLMGLMVQPQQEHFAIYTLIYVWKQYFQLLN